MNKNKRFHTLFSLLLVLALSGCNLPFLAPEPTPTPLPTATEVPTNTPVPPTETPTLPPPTETATLPPPTPAITATSFLVPTAIPTKAPTLAPILPIPRDLFEGTFEGGRLSFRIGTNPNVIIPKLVTLKKAQCKGGGTISDTISFEPPPTFWLLNGKFTITAGGDQVYWTGQFNTSKRASGSITLKVKKDNKACVIGPVAWTATAP